MASVRPLTDFIACPICTSRAEVAFCKSGFELLDCTECGHRFCAPVKEQNQHVDEVYSDEYFFGEGDGYDDYLAQKDLLIRQGETYAKRLGKHLPKTNTPNRVLDVGAAAGFLLQGFKNQGWEGIGVETNESVAKFGRDSFGLDIRTQTIEEFVDGNQDQRFDAVINVQVLPHLYDPVAMMNAIHGLLKPDGLFLIETWNRKSMTARLFGKRWHEYNPPSVLHWFSRNGLRKVFEKTGFEVIDRGRPTKWISVGNGIGLIRYSLRDSAVGRIASSPLALVPKGLKAPYFLDDVFWMVGRKL